MRCEASGVLVAKDKAIKRFIVRNIVDASAIRDIQDSSVVDGVLLYNSLNMALCGHLTHIAKSQRSTNLQAHKRGLVLLCATCCW